MAEIKSGASSDKLTIDATSKAARITPYDTLGNNRGTKATYRAATNTTVAAASNAVPFFIIEGSNTKTVIVQRLVVSGITLTAVTYVAVQVNKYSSAISGGTPVTLTAVPLDSNSAAATVNTLQVYTAAPTAGSLVGVVAERRVLAQATTAAAAGIPPTIEFDFRTQGSENTGIYLRGTGQGLSLEYGAAPGGVTTLSVEVEWTEE